MEEYPECSICLDIFGNNMSHIKAPKILKCGDTFCKECLEKIIKISNEDFFFCPMCKEKIKKEESINEYTTNKDLIKVINACFNIPTKSSKKNEGEKAIKYNIILLGNSTVGKTSIFQRLSKDIFSDKIQATIGSDINLYYLKYKNQKYNLILGIHQDKINLNQ